MQIVDYRLKNPKSEILNLKSKISKVVFETKSTSETIRIGKRIGSLLQPGDVVALVGELGTGKTQFIKGIAAGVQVGNPTYISSPSFTLINEYRGKTPFYHIDLFRLKTEKEVEELGLEEYFGSEGITAVEWADRIPSLLPRELIWIKIYYIGKQTRSIEIVGQGKRYEVIIDEFKRSWVQGIT